MEQDEDWEYGVRKTVKKLNPREPSKEERESREDALAVSQLVRALCQRARQGGVLQTSQEGS